MVKNPAKLRNCTLEPDAQWNWKFKKGSAFFSPWWRKAWLWFCERNISIVFQSAILVSLEEQLWACRAGCAGHIFNYTSPSLGDNCSGLIRIKTYSTTLKNALMLAFLNPSVILGNMSTAISACKQKRRTLLLHAHVWGLAGEVKIQLAVFGKLWGRIQVNGPLIFSKSHRHNSSETKMWLLNTTQITCWGKTALWHVLCFFVSPDTQVL